VDRIDLSHAVVIAPSAQEGTPRGHALELLLDEVEKRTGLRLHVFQEWPDASAVEATPRIVLASHDEKDLLSASRFPESEVPEGFAEKSEGYFLHNRRQEHPAPVVWVVANDDRGFLFGIGGLLREMWMGEKRFTVPGDLRIATAPARPLRGHQLGFRGKANSWDAWTPAQFEQYILDLAVFGGNAVENIPFEDPHDAPQMTVTRAAMNLKLSEICAKYGLEYWLWMPVMEHREEQEGTVALETEEERQALLDQWEKLYSELPRLDGVFIPSSDPGDNRADYLLAFMERVNTILTRHHPQAKVWLSHQGLEKKETDYLFSFLQDRQPDWFGGLVYGPWTFVTLTESRTRLPEKYPIRDYPDITHTIRCQYPVHHWDRAFAITEGRECICPRPVDMKTICDLYGPDTEGVLTYSDGVHDDVNKVIWSALAWDPDLPVEDILVDYGDYFVGSGYGQRVAEGLLGLERNWRGPLETNVGVEGTLRVWQEMEELDPGKAATNWRFQMGLLRAYYDAYLRERLLHETAIEKEVNEVLAAVERRSKDLTSGSDAAFLEVERLLFRTNLETPAADYRERILELADGLYETIRLQTSLRRHGASDYDRGTMIDMLDTPLNNRRWIEDRLYEIRQMEEEDEKVAALNAMAHYEVPVPGTIYDDLGHGGHQPRLVREEGETLDPAMRWTLKDKLLSWDPYIDRRRLSGQDGVGNGGRWSAPWSIGMRYVSLERDKEWTLRFAAERDKSARYALFAEGREIKPMGPAPSEEVTEEYAIPTELTEDGILEVEWRVEGGKGILLTEAWLIPGE
jgi:hypothetical protein